MIAMFERFKLAIKYRATGCPSPWRWAGTAMRRDRGANQTSPARMPQRPYGCDTCQGTGWFAVTMRQIEKCRCVPTGRNHDPHPSMTRPDPPPAPP